MALKISSLLLITLFALPVYSQDLSQFNDSSYEPEELNQNSEERFKKMYKDYLKKHGNTVEISEKDFVYEHNYFLDRLNKSGSIFYGDEISKYLNELKDFILDDPILRSEIKVYLTNFPNVNAFTNDFGNIYVNIASISKLSTEEELLFLLAHEIGHIIRRHSRESKIYSNKLRNERWGSGEEARAFSEHAFSRIHELQADSIALSLLKSKVDLNFGISLMQSLEKSSNPILSGPVNALFLTGHDRDLYEAWKLMSSHFTDSTLLSEISRSSEHSTHPSIEQRIKQMNSMLSLVSEEESSYVPTGKFDKAKTLANALLLDIYLENSMYIAALDLIIKYRLHEPDNPDLIRRQINILALLAQKTWDNDEFDRIINNFGNSCDDEDYLRLRKILLSMSNEDMNIFAYRSISGLEKQLPQNEAPSEAKKFTYLLLKRNHSNFWNYNDSTETFELAQWDQNLINVEWETSLSAEDSVSLGELKEKGYLIADINDSHYFLKQFLFDSPMSEEESGFILNEQKLTDSTYIPMTEVDFFEIPKYLALLNLNGIFLRASTFDPSAKTALYQSDNFYFDCIQRRYYAFDFEQSLKMDNAISNDLAGTHTYSEDFSNAAGEGVSVQDNYLHKLIGIWIQERTDDPVYSKVEDKLLPILKAKDIKYIAYRICIVSKNKGFIGRSYSNFYEIYFDIDTGRVAYIGKIGSKQRFNKHHLRHFNYLSNYNKTRPNND